VAGPFRSIGFNTGDFPCVYTSAAISYERSLFNVPEVCHYVRLSVYRGEISRSAV